MAGHDSNYMEYKHLSLSVSLPTSKYNFVAAKLISVGFARVKPATQQRPPDLSSPGENPVPLIHPHCTQRTAVSAPKLPPTLCRVLGVEHSRSTPVSALTLSPTLCRILSVGHTQCTALSALKFSTTLCRVLNIGPAHTVCNYSQCTETFTNGMPSSECRALTEHPSQCTHTFTNVMPSSECRIHTV